jgi:transcriptional regulator with XRE-family HTH domain
MSNETLYNSPQMDELFSDFDPAEAARVENRMLLAAKIDDAIKAKGWSKKEFAGKMGKSPSEISKWLSGTHNFTSDTLVDIAKILGTSLIDLEEQKLIPKPVQTIRYQIIISSTMGKAAIPMYGAELWRATPIHEKRKPLRSKMNHVTLVKYPKTQLANA